MIRRTVNKFIEGLIISSGFANILNLLKHLQIIGEVSFPQFDQECVDMVKNITVPTLVIHGGRDQIAPYQEALSLYENLGSSNKKIITISDADHNDIMNVGFNQYFGAITEFIKYNN